MSTGIILYWCMLYSVESRQEQIRSSSLLLLPKDILKVELDLRAGNALRVHPTQQSSPLVEVVGDRTLQGPSLQVTRVFRPLITHLGTFWVLFGPGALNNGTLAFL